MKVEILSSTDERDYRSAEAIIIDGETYVELMDGEPEDNSLARNFSIDWEDLIKKLNPNVKIEYKELTWEEYCDTI